MAIEDRRIIAAKDITNLADALGYKAERALVNPPNAARISS
jgi:hypothetical protein